MKLKREYCILVEPLWHSSFEIWCNAWSEKIYSRTVCMKESYQNFFWVKEPSVYKSKRCLSQNEQTSARFSRWIWRTHFLWWKSSCFTASL